MFDPQREGSAPDVLDCAADPAVRICTPPQPVWVDLKVLTRKSGLGFKHTPGGLFVGGHERGCLWGWVVSGDGIWLGVVTVELHRGGHPVMTAQALVPHWALIPRRSGNLDRDLRAAGRHG